MNYKYTKKKTHNSFRPKQQEYKIYLISIHRMNLPVGELMNSVDVVGIAVRFGTRSSFAHANKLKIVDKTMTMETFIFAV